MLTALLLAGATGAASPEPEVRRHSLTAAVVGCSCLAATEHDNDGGGRGVLGGRAQYDYDAPEGARIGLVAAYESVRHDLTPKATSVAMLGPVLTIMGGDEIRGGVRFSGGVAYAYDPRWKGVESNRVHGTGFFIDISAELAVRVAPPIDFVVDVAVFSVRSFGYDEDPAGASPARWWYGMAVLPLMANLGMRVSL